MEFEFTDTFYVNETDLEEMCSLCKEKNCTPQEALDAISCGWEDFEFYTVCFVEEQIIAEINRRLKQSESCE